METPAPYSHWSLPALPSNSVNMTTSIIVITLTTYKTDGSRKALMQQPEFVQEFEDAKTRIRHMEVRFVEEPDQLRQAVLEMYVSVALETPFNDFDTH